jgi:Na+-driven multidrug efflux pump
MHQNPDVAYYTQQYNFAFFPAMVMISLNNCQAIFLNMSGHANVKMTCDIIGLLFHIVLCYYFVYIKEFGIAGTGYASTITNFISLICMVIYTFFIKDI